MTIEQAYQILKNHNHWRKCNDENCNCEMVCPFLLGDAIDFILKYIDDREKIELINH